MSRIKKWVFGSLCVIFMCAGPAAAVLTAHPRFAVREAVTCGKCHVDNQGGGLRNEYGAGYYSQEVLPIIPWDKFGKKGFTAALSDFIRAGTDIRTQYYRYADQFTTSDAFFPMEANLYLGVTPSDHLTLYLEESMLPTGAATNLWGQVNFGKGNTYLRFGKFVQSYGLRVADHTAFTRGGNVGGIAVNAGTAQIPILFQGLHWKPENNATGVEVGYSPAGWNATGSLIKTAGQSQYSVSLNANKAFWLGSWNALMGGSYFHGSYYSQLKAYSYSGLYAGLNRGIVTIMGEADLTQDYPMQGQRGLATLADLAIQVHQGIFLTLEHSLFDANLSQANDELVRYSLGADLFPVSYLEIMPQYRILRATATSSYSRSELILQTHFWF